MSARIRRAARASLLAAILCAAVPPVVAWPGGLAQTKGTPTVQDPADCADLSSVPIRYDIYYSMDDYPPGTDPESVTTILEDVFNFGGGCTGCHNGSAADGGSIRFNQASSVTRVVFEPSYRNFDLFRALPNNPEASLVYSMLNCTPPETYPGMPPSMTGDQIAIGLRALIFDWIATGARGSDQDGNDVSDVVFRDQVESDRMQRFLAAPPPPP